MSKQATTQHKAFLDAAMKNKIDTVSQMLHKGAVAIDAPELRSNGFTGMTALGIAIYLGHKDIVELLLRNGADPTLCKGNHKSHNTSQTIVDVVNEYAGKDIVTCIPRPEKTDLGFLSCGDNVRKVQPLVFESVSGALSSVLEAFEKVLGSNYVFSDDTLSGLLKSLKGFEALGENGVCSDDE